MGKKKHSTRRMYRQRRKDKENHLLFEDDFYLERKCKICGASPVLPKTGICLACTYGETEERFEDEF
jgi:hypothetical protein